MTLYKRGQTWWIRLTTLPGQKIRQSTHTSDRRLAQQEHDRLLAQLSLKPSKALRKQYTLAEAVSRWLSETTYKATHERDRRVLGWFSQHLGAMRLEDLTADHIKQLLRRREREVSVSTINCYTGLIRAVLKRAEREWEWMDRAPYLKLTPVVSKRIRYLTRAEACELLRHLPKHLSDMVSFSLQTGLRKSNVTGLRWEQVDLERGVAWIHADQSKSRRPIGVPLCDEAVDLLKGLSPQPSGFVFTYKGNRIQQVNTKAFRKGLAQAGIENFRWHDLRHTWASWHIQNGTPIHILQELGGWHSFEMVKRYAHLSPQHLREYANLIGQKAKEKEGGDLGDSRNP